MKITKVQIRNFRLLQNVEFSFEQFVTLIVGRNNSGKTSVTEIFRRLLSESSPSFTIADFSLGVHNCFWEAFLLFKEDAPQESIRQKLPQIELKLTISYDSTSTTLGPISDFIIDLDPDSSDAVALFSYQLGAGQIGKFFEDFETPSQIPTSEEKEAFFKELKERIPKLFSVQVWAIDPSDETNTKAMDLSSIRSVVITDFVNAQRGLDDTTHRENDVIGKILERLLHTALMETAPTTDRVVAKSLETAVQNVQKSLDTDFSHHLANLLPAFELFGYPGLNDPRLRTETVLNIQRLLENHTKVRYAGINGVNLPEGYNGLGSRNLIFILLKLLDFFKSYISKAVNGNIHLIFIEEPEAHLHPQMQEVFIRKLEEVAKVFAETFNKGNPWSVQFIISTHSSHIANEAKFSSMRYFLSKKHSSHEAIFASTVKDLKLGLLTTPPMHLEFLQKYMTLTRCDLLFADKAILIEGPSERLLMPQMIRKIDSTASLPNLSSQYVSIVEIGGAYAHVFFPLIRFLELKTLVITDLDTTKINQNRRYEACKVSEGEKTSNPCLKEWFGDLAPQTLFAKTDEEKTNGVLRIAFQIPEAADIPCGRSFEAAFMLANKDSFEISGSFADQEELVWDKTQKIDKTDFAIEHGVKNENWNVPKYFSEGLRWLAIPADNGITEIITQNTDAVPDVEEIVGNPND